MVDKPQLKIGDSVWVFDPNRRVYRRDAKGNSVGGPIYREHWREHFIVGETRVSWLVGFTRDLPHDHRCVLRMPKADPTGVAEKGFGRRRVLLSPAAVEDDAWVAENRCRISDAVNRCRDADTLRRIAEMVGYKEDK